MLGQEVERTLSPLSSERKLIRSYWLVSLPNESSVTGELRRNVFEIEHSTVSELDSLLDGLTQCLTFWIYATYHLWVEVIRFRFVGNGESPDVTQAFQILVASSEFSTYRPHSHLSSKIELVDWSSVCYCITRLRYCAKLDEVRSRISRNFLKNESLNGSTN